MATEGYKGHTRPHFTTSTASSTHHRRSSTLLQRLVLAAVLLVLYATYHATKTMPSTDPDLSQYTQSIFLPFIHKFKPKHVPQVMCTIQGVQIKMPVDTGSTGILVGAPILPDVDPKAGEPAHHFFTSSRILYVGRLVKLELNFKGEADAYATAKVPVLVVDRSYRCPWYDPEKDRFECPPGPKGEKAVERDTSQITYMGIGYGRNCPRDGMPIAAPEVNAFLNVDTINGTSVPSNAMRAGFTISTAGVTVGLTQDNTQGYAFQNLEPGCTHSEDTRDWAMAKMSLSIDGGKASSGSVLVDTGIAQMYIRAGDGTPIPNMTIPNPNPKGYAKRVRRIKPGTKVTVGFPVLDDSAPSYSFVAGAGSCMEPTYVVPDIAAGPAFVNTGRNFLFGYSIAFDAVGGRFGIRPAVPSSSASL